MVRWWRWLHDEGGTKSLWERGGFRRMEASESEWGEECDFKMSAALRRLWWTRRTLADDLWRLFPRERAQPSNENKVSDGDRERAGITREGL
jgi:hypothetical protein